MTTSHQPDPAASADVERLVAKAVAVRRAGQLDASARYFEQALARDPRHPEALSSYAMLLLEAGDLRGAIRFGQAAIAVDPGRPSAHHVVGQAFCRAGRLAEGIAELQRAIALRPDAFEARVHLGNALLDAGDPAGAEQHLARARDLAPNSAAVHVNLGNVYRRMEHPGKAIDAYRRAIELDDRVPQALNNLGTLLAELGDVDGALAAYREALALAPERASTWSNLLLALSRTDRVTATELATEHRAYGRYFGQRIRPLPPVAPRPLAERRLKIGYVSSDFLSHALALFIEPLLAGHDRKRFEIYCFHCSRSADDVTARLAGLVEHFVPVADMSDDALAERVRSEAIDILNDLNGHTAHNRLLLFLLKPAPIQVTWLGYLGTTGLSTMDYRLTDARADPPGVTEALHTETLWRLPDTLWCYQPYAFAPDVGSLPAQAHGHVTFASLNSPGKVSANVVGLWGQLLAALPDARLLLITSPFAQRIAELDRLFALAGVTPGRVEYLPRQSTADYLALYNRADMALDTWPYTGAATTCDALWMGVPVVTLAGDRSVSRSGASILWNAGLRELVAEGPQDYVSRALTLARDLPRLGKLRATLRERMRASRLTDAARFTRAVEDAYRAMARRESGRLR
ncbi:MAG: tetratricopeptide repeat protein [Betaproteobacteria bacterium]|nr:MAG: tetratricopeptide repeat protein [Betaproteobacteria bacterium]